MSIDCREKIKQLNEELKKVTEECYGKEKSLPPQKALPQTEPMQIMKPQLKKRMSQLPPPPPALIPPPPLPQKQPSPAKQNLATIIENTRGAPTIVNENSNFVVVTYWWGRGVLNKNTARPCASYYENFTKKIINKYITALKQFQNKFDFNSETSIMKVIDQIKINTLLKDVIQKQIKEYMYNMNTYVDVYSNTINVDKIFAFLEKQKKTGKTPEEYEFKDAEYLFVILLFIAYEFVKSNKQNIAKRIIIDYKISELEKRYKNRSISDADAKSAIEKLKSEKSKVETDIKVSMNAKKQYVLEDRKQVLGIKEVYKLFQPIYKDPSIQDKSLNELLSKEMTYLKPLQFEEMIQRWEQECAKHKCNYMAIEYPEFARPGGYQMAINAKPLFIKKALELCGGRGVLYIDGDMNIRKYPSIFDLKDVDYMARGWWMDPRSSYKFDESISYDPYSFETSGGTMFFANTPESVGLLNAWIKESDNPRQKGKADDRIISMIFNSKKYLLDMKIIQLPIEYLWLTLDYNDRLMEHYDYNFHSMDSTIFIDHPECLTSEDTASGSGASSDRTPIFYGFLDYSVDPVSEEFYEYLAFPDKSYVNSMKTYFNYMSDAYYFDDGNETLYRKKFVVPGRDPTENEQPLYITPYDKKFGKKNAISEQTIRRAGQMKLYDQKNGMVEIREEDEIEPSDLIPLIYKHLDQGINVLYRPKNASSSIYKNFMDQLNTKYQNIEFAFTPTFNKDQYNDIFRPLINTEQCIYFKSSSRFLKNFITMFQDLNQLSGYINFGSYQFMSSMRVAYLIDKKKSNKSVAMVGGGSKLPNFEKEILEADLYKSKMSGGFIQRLTRKSYRIKRRVTKKKGYN